MKSNSFINWADDLDAAITLCDRQGIILYMNNRSILQFEKYGGEVLIGKSLIDCHPEPSRSKLLHMLSNPVGNIYTTEKNGIRKLIVQKPWIQDNDFRGIVEISFELPVQMIHFIRE